MKIEIEQFYPCGEALKFRKQFSTFKEAWEACPRGDWMLWIASKVNVDERKLFLVKGLCAQTVVHLMKDERSVNAVNAAIAYGKGEISRDDLRASANAASYAASAAYASNASAAYAAYAAASNTSDAYNAAAYAYNAADYAADSRKANEKQTADICREVLTEEVLSRIEQTQSK